MTTPITVTAGEAIVIAVDYNGSPIPHVWQSTADGGTDTIPGLTYFYDQNNAVWDDFATFTGTGGNNDSYNGAFTVKGLLAVPEPSTFALMGLALLGVGALARRQRRSGK